MGRPTKKPAQAIVASARVLQDGRHAVQPYEVAPRELSPSELLLQPTVTLGKILSTLDHFVNELHKRAVEQSMSLKDVRALTDIVKAHATLRQTQLAEDAFVRQSQTLATDTDVAMLLIEAVKAGGPQAVGMLREAIATIDASLAAGAAETSHPTFEQTPDAGAGGQIDSQEPTSVTSFDSSEGP